MLYEEVWECRFPSKQTIEAELLDLQALAPDLIDDLRSLFKEAVTDSLASILGEDEARALVMQIAKTGFENKSVVFAALDSIFHRRDSQILKDAIVEEFHTNVHLLLEKMKRTRSQAASRSENRERLQKISVLMRGRKKRKPRN